jgi:hypothetical protein
MPPNDGHHNTSVFKKTANDHRRPNEAPDAIPTRNTEPKRKPTSNEFERIRKRGTTISKTPKQTV